MHVPCPPSPQKKKHKETKKVDEKIIRLHVRETRCNSEEVAVNMEQSAGYFKILNYDFVKQTISCWNEKPQLIQDTLLFT